MLDELNHIINQFFDESEAERRLLLQNKSESEKKDLKKALTDYQSKKADVENAIKDIYIDKVKGIITEQEFMDLKSSFQMDARIYSYKIQEINNRLSDLKQKGEQECSVKDILKRYRNIEHLDRTIVETLIDYIEIGRNDSKIHKSDLPPIMIHWKF